MLNLLQQLTLFNLMLKSTFKMIQMRMKQFLIWHINFQMNILLKNRLKKKNHQQHKN